MDILMISIVVALIICFFILVWKIMSTKKQLSTANAELKFFKAEKELYNEVMMVLSNNYTIIYANQAAQKLFSLDAQNNTYGIGKKIELRVNDQIPEEFFHVLKKLHHGAKDSFKLEYTDLFISGQKKKVNIYIDKRTWQENQAITCVIDMTPCNQAEITNEKKDGSIDFLTGLPSQFLALSDINALVTESKQKSEFFGLFLLGIDNFNDIQTTLGLGYTNQILKTLAQYFKKNHKENIKIYRMESNKFLFVVYGLDESKLAREMAREIIVSVGHIYSDNNDIRLTSSIGIALYPQDGENANKLIDNVYIALNKAQEESESNIELYNVEYQSVHVDEIQMNEDIRKGLMKNQFLLYYQPIFDLAGEVIVGAEALLRWKHPKHGVIAADKFLGIAEKTGLIVDLGEYVFNEVIQQAKKSITKHPSDFQITINLSLKEMQVEELLPRLEMLFNKYEVDKSKINLDISERIAMENIDKTARDFKLFKDFGLSLSLDHFGAGYSSFKYLGMLPLDMIKIDRSLIFDLTLNLNHQTTVKAIIHLAHTMGYKVVAEGVETSQEASILQALHCDYAQGYLYSRPLPASELDELLV